MHPNVYNHLIGCKQMVDRICEQNKCSAYNKRRNVCHHHTDADTFSHAVVFSGTIILSNKGGN